MKRCIFFAGLALVSPLAGIAGAQEPAPPVLRVVEERTEAAPANTTVTGMLTEYGNERLLVKAGPTGEPVKYSYSGATIYTDEAGAPVSVTKVKPGMPVTITYIQTATGPAVTRMVLRKEMPDPIAVANAATRTTTVGTVTELAADAILVRSTTAVEPVSYSFTAVTTYVDETGAPVPSTTVKAGTPVTVYYTKEGSKLVATKVVVRNAAPVAESITKTTKTTTVSGTISDFTPAKRIVIRSETDTAPVPYTFTKTTTYVNEAGEPVSAQLLKAGLPVTLHFTTVGDARVVDRVVVRKTITKTER